MFFNFNAPCLYADVILIGLEHLRVVVRVELDSKHIGDTGIPQALVPQGVVAACRESMPVRVWEEQQCKSVRKYLGGSEGSKGTLLPVANSSPSRWHNRPTLSVAKRLPKHGLNTRYHNQMSKKRIRPYHSTACGRAVIRVATAPTATTLAAALNDYLNPGRLDPLSSRH